MKKRYQSQKHLKSVEGRLADNLDHYASVIAEKYGGKKKDVMKNYVIQVFKTLDEMGVVQYIDTKCFAKSVNKLFFNFGIKGEDGHRSNAAGLYNGLDGSITAKRRFNFGDRVFLHEFMHLLSGELDKIDERQVETLVSSGGKSLTLALNVGFKKAELRYYKNDIELANASLSLEEMINTILVNTDKATQNDIDYAKAWMSGYGIMDIELPDFQKMDLRRQRSEEAQQKLQNQYKYSIKQYLKNKMKENKPFVISPNPYAVFKVTPNKSGADFYVEIFVNQVQNSEITDSGRNINEGCTEFLAALVDAKMKKKPVLINAYMTYVKAVSCLYSILGADLYDGYFNNSLELVAKKAGMNFDVLDSIADIFEARSDKRASNAGYLANSYFDMHDKMLSMFEVEILRDVLTHKDKYPSPDSIYTAIYASYMEYSKNLYFGQQNTSILKFYEESIFGMLVDSFDSVLKNLKAIGQQNKPDEYITKEQLDMFAHVDPLNDAEVAEAYLTFKKLNEIEYFFIDPSLEKITPTKFLTGERKVIVHDEQKQNFIRSKSRIKVISDKKIKEIKYPNAEERKLPDDNKLWILETTSQNKD